MPLAFFAIVMPRQFAEKPQELVGVIAVVALGAALGGLLGIATFAAARHEALER